MDDDLLEQLRTRHIKLGYELPTESLFSAAADEIERLNAENARLREALEPFAKAGELFGDRGEYSDMTIYLTLPAAGKQYQIVGDDLRRARAALAGKEEK